MNSNRNEFVALGIVLVVIAAIAWILFSSSTASVGLAGGGAVGRSSSVPPSQELSCAELTQRYTTSPGSIPPYNFKTREECLKKGSEATPPGDVCSNFIVVGNLPDCQTQGRADCTITKRKLVDRIIQCNFSSGLGAPYFSLTIQWVCERTCHKDTIGNSGTNGPGNI